MLCARVNPPRGTSVPTLARALGILLACVLLGACAGLQRQPPAASAPDAASFDYERDGMLQLLAGQFALQANDVGSAARHFTLAAAQSGDPAVAEEATRLALATRDWPLARQALSRWQALAPADRGILQARAWIALGEQDSAAAEADLTSLVQAGDETGWRLAAQALLGAGDPRLATGLLDRIATDSHLGTKEASWIAVSQLAFKLDDKALAERLARRALARFHGSESYAWSARLALDRGDRKSAVALYGEALKRDPANRRLRGAYAALLAEDGDDSGAARVLGQGPQDDVSWSARAAYLARAGDDKALARLYDEIAAAPAPRSGRSLYLLGQLAEMLDQRKAALDWYAMIPQYDERWFDAQIRRAVVLGQTQETEQALVLVRRLEQLAVGDRERLAGTYLLEAELLTQRDRFGEARAVYSRALQALPEDADIIYARALFEITHGDLAAGVRDLRQLVALKPDNAEALNALGYTLADHARSGDPALEEAGKLIGRAIELKPDEPAIMDSMGWWHYRMGDIDAALPLLRAAWKQQPDAEIAAHLGEVLWRKGEHAEARRIWQQGRDQDADNPVLLETVKRLAP